MDQRLLDPGGPPAGDIDGLLELYEPDAALIAQPGSVAYGREQVRAALEGFLALNGRITLDTKLAVTVGDLAYLANTWSLSGTGPDGNPVAMGATTAEVARRQSDGTWRYVIDNAWGDQAVTGVEVRRARRVGWRGVHLGR
jgi:uncharacterized protein (TIGR02246 family)